MGIPWEWEFPFPCTPLLHGLAGNTGRKNDVKNRHLGTIPQVSRAISSQLRHVLTIGKKLVKQQYLPHMPLQYGELGPLAAEIVSLVWGTPANFNGVCVLAASLQGTRVVGVIKVCGVEQRAPPTFGRAIITLGFGPHSS